jgi:predicted regulator of amino acid metabolism with ACT domain
MKNINQEVWHILKSDLAIQKDLQRKLINTRALAKYILQKYPLRASLDSVISAIRRFQSQEKFKEEEQSLLSCFKGAVVSTKNNVAVLTLNMRPADFFKKFTTSKKTSLRVTTGSREVKLIVENPKLAEMKKHFNKEEIKKVQDNLSEINVKLSTKSLETRGVLARIASEIALANINLQEMVVCPPEFLIYVKEKDIVKAHEAILKLITNK